MLSDALKTFADAPTGAARARVVADINARISALETELGLSHKLPTLNFSRAKMRLDELEKQLAAKNAAPPAAAAAPAAVAPAPPPFVSSGDSVTDAAIKAAGSHNLSHHKAKARRDRLFAEACALPAGSISRACAEANLETAQKDLQSFE